MALLVSERRDRYQQRAARSQRQSTPEIGALLHDHHLPFLRYPVKVQAFSHEAPPQPLLSCHAPFPYGTNSAPPRWQSRYPYAYLSVPPLYDSDIAEQAHEPPLYGAETFGRLGDQPSQQQSANPSPMSLKTRLRGCFLLLLLGLAPCCLLFLWVLGISSMKKRSEQTTLRFLTLGVVPAVLFLYLFVFLLKESTRSPIGMVLTAKAVTVDEVASFIPTVAPKIEFEISSSYRHESKVWQYHHHEDVSPPSEGIMVHISRLSAKYKLVRLRLPARVSLADDQTRGDFMTKLHSFYLGKRGTLSAEVKQDYVAVITPTGTGVPLNYRFLRGAFVISSFFMLSWIPRAVVLLFFPSWVDPACSPVFCHRKVLHVAPRGAVV